MYNYRAQMAKDILEFLQENGADLDEDYWFEEAELADEVTGNSSGSYFCDRVKAREAVLANGPLLEETVDFFDDSMKLNFAQMVASGNWEAVDVLIRLYIFPEAFSVVWEAWEETYFVLEGGKNEH